MKITRENALTTSLVMFLLVMSVLVHIATRGPDPIHDHSTYRYNATGSRALYTLLERIGVRVARHCEPLSKLPDDARACWIVSPTTPLTDSELSELMKWVRAGHFLVIASSLGVYDESELEGVGWQAETVSLASSRLAKWLGSEFGATVSAAGNANVALRPEQSSPLKQTVGEVLVTGKARLSVSSSDEKAAVHLKDERGVVAADWPAGRGTVFVLTDPNIFSNAKLLEADNVTFTYNLSRWHGNGGVVYFDEFHHGFSNVPSLGSAMRRSAAGWGIYQAILAVLVVVFGRALRFGAPVPAFTRRRRSALEYVRSVANLYRAAQAGSAVLEVLYTDFRRRAVARLGTHPGISNEKLALLIAARDDVDPARLSALLSALAAGARAAHVSDDDVLRLAREISRYEGQHPRAGE